MNMIYCPVVVSISQYYDGDSEKRFSLSWIKMLKLGDQILTD